MTPMLHAYYSSPYWLKIMLWTSNIHPTLLWARTQGLSSNLNASIEPEREIYASRVRLSLESNIRPTITCFISVRSMLNCWFVSPNTDLMMEHTSIHPSASSTIFFVDRLQSGSLFYLLYTQSHGLHFHYPFPYSWARLSCHAATH